jgi:hypothetical protein
MTHCVGGGRWRGVGVPFEADDAVIAGQIVDQGDVYAHKKAGLSSNVPGDAPDEFNCKCGHSERTESW